MKHKRRIGADIIVPFLLAVVVFGGLFLQKYRQASVLPTVPPAQQGTAAVRKVVLFFADHEGRLAREARETERCSTPTDCARSLLDELFSGPVGDFDDLLPEWTSINDVTLAGDTVTVDLDRVFSENLPSGSSSEMLAVYAIVNTICANLPEVRQVRITIDGDPRSRLRHLDLSEPLEPNYELEAPHQSPVRPLAPPVRVAPR
ncbi:GerMN domain-containing protein [Trichlorobacter ammonificans]|uniref:Germane domain-containing protein n=1 Tax=Trichlorobacter ammonificans TaxID=2916410 RepID=A0ABM9DB60_9BACT|nr:GerMN domain-containing protein [Trichlorobacter ammonificans]CAH2031907.1 Germane domain-containing protein [Trichlorobacter ammonificans]